MFKTQRLLALGAAASLLTLSAQAAPLQIDMSTGAGLAAQAGWESIGGTGNPSGNFSGYTDLATGNITVGLTNISFDRLYRNGFTDATPDDFPGTDLDEMYGDLLFRNNASADIDITITGLKAGTYTITTHHLNAPNTPSQFDLIRTDSRGTSTVGNYAMGLGNTSSFTPTVVTFNVVADGSNPITVKLDATFIGTGGNTGGWWGVNGMEIALVPEPSSLALLAMGGLMIARRRRG